MYYLINNSDNSYNCHSDEPFLDIYKQGTTEVFVEQTFEGDVTLAFFDVESHSFYLNPEITLQTEEEKEEEVQESIEKEALYKKVNELKIINSFIEKLKPLLSEKQMAILAEEEPQTSVNDIEAALDDEV